MTSKFLNAQRAYVWIWLPLKTRPIVAGRILKEGELYTFTYGKTYLEDPHAIPLSPVELPLERGKCIPTGMNIIHSCLRDGAPDAWGRRLIQYQYATQTANELDYMLLSGSNRIGALDFQLSSSEYIPRESNDIDLEKLLLVTEYVEKNQPIPKELEAVLLRGTSVGGARPKALVRDKKNKKEYIAKFSSTTDTFNMIKSEFLAMKLAKTCGLNVAEVILHKTLNKDVLLVERFDRINQELNTQRKFMLSGLSLLGLNELEARYASYQDLADIIRQRFNNPQESLQEWYKRLVFNVLIGNTDDHARNHSAFWDGVSLCLTPAYDLCPQHRVGQEATQAMSIGGVEGNYSTIKNVISVADSFQLEHTEASRIVEVMISSIKAHWEKVCQDAKLSSLEKESLWGKSILNPFCFH